MGKCIFQLSILWLFFSAITAQNEPADNSRGVCTPFSMDSSPLGSFTELSSAGLVREQLADVADGTLDIMVQIIEFNVVCEAAGLNRDTVSSVSVVVRYQCTGCMSTTDLTTDTRQFQFNCATTDSFLDTSGNSVSFGAAEAPAVANFTTTRDEQCGLCFVPGTFGITSDATTFCASCRDCTEGQQRCIGIDPMQCCNYYLNDVCVDSCGDNLIGDPVTFDCGCGEIPAQDGRTTTYSDRFALGSMATHMCDEGFKRNSPAGTATESICTMTTGWTPEPINCEAITCDASEVLAIEDGTVDFEISFGSVATFTCNEGFTLNGDRTRTCTADGWDGKNPTCDIMVATTGDASSGGSGQQSACNIGCIIGIVLAVVGAIIMAIVVAAVAYAIYSYLNHPDTKLAKFDTDINGVARDNPLYVDPEAVVEDGAEAA